MWSGGSTLQMAAVSVELEWERLRDLHFCGSPGGLHTYSTNASSELLQSSCHLGTLHLVPESSNNTARRHCCCFPLHALLMHDFFFLNPGNKTMMMYSANALYCLGWLVQFFSQGQIQCHTITVIPPAQTFVLATQNGVLCGFFWGGGSLHP